jgi:tetratricopeptide (TPR) repeat protein
VPRLPHLTLCALLLVSGGALAQPEPGAGAGLSQDEQAQRLADEGVEAYRSGKYATAVKLFKQAYALRQEPALVYNLAKTYDKLDQRNEALEYYRRYLVAEGTDEKLRARAEERVAALSREEQKDVAPPPPPLPLPSRPPPRPGRLFFYSGVALAGAGLAGIIAGAALFGVAGQQYGDFQSATDELDKRPLGDATLALGSGGIASLAVGGAILGGGAALLGLAYKKGFFRKERLALIPAPGALLLQGAF